MIHTNIFYITTNNKTKFNYPKAQVTLCTKLRLLIYLAFKYFGFKCIWRRRVRRYQSGIHKP